MISAFKHIRLSGHNLIPLLDSQTDTLRLSLGGTGVAYYQELTGLSGYLQDLINTSNDDVTRINNLSGAVNLQGANGVSIGVDYNTNIITISGDTSSLTNFINLLSGSLNETGIALVNRINETGISLTNTITSLSGSLDLTGLHVYANFVRKATQQSFTLDVPSNIESTGITFPVAFSSTPASVNITLEVPGDVMYMTAIKNKTNTGFTAEFSDIILEEGVKLNTFASNPNNT